MLQGTVNGEFEQYTLAQTRKTFARIGVPTLNVQWRGVQPASVEGLEGYLDVRWSGAVLDNQETEAVGQFQIPGQPERILEPGSTLAIQDWNQLVYLSFSDGELVGCVGE